MSVIWTNGCFDILHRGHIEMLQYAASLGNKLVVGIDSDSKVRLDKGDERPIHCQEDRKFLLESIECIDKVVIFDSPEELSENIQELQPKYLVVGGDWRGKKVVGSEHAAEVKFFDRIKGYSTTAIMDKK